MKNKFPTVWFSMVPKKYNKNAIITYPHRAKKISLNFDDEVKRIKEKYEIAVFPMNFSFCVVRQFREPRLEKKIVLTFIIFLLTVMLIIRKAFRLLY